MLCHVIRMRRDVHAKTSKFVYNFFRGKSYFYESDVKIKKDVENTTNTLIATIEKNEMRLRLVVKGSPLETHLIVR